MAKGTRTYSAWQPSIVLPKRQPPSACAWPCGVLPPHCGLVAVEAGEALAAGRDGADDDALPTLVAGHARPQLLDHADRLVADDAAALDRVLALEDVDIGAADRRGGDPDQRVARPDLRHRLLVEDDTARLDEHGRLHRAHHLFSFLGV